MDLIQAVLGAKVWRGSAVAIYALWVLHPLKEPQQALRFQSSWCHAVKQGKSILLQQLMLWDPGSMQQVNKQVMQRGEKCRPAGNTA